MISKNKRKVIISILLLFSLFAIISSTNAADKTLNSSNNFKLEIENATSNSVIRLDPTNQFSLDSSNVNITVNKNITIRSSSTSKNAVINLNNNGRAFTVASGAKLTLINITIINGKAFNGGAIFNEGTVILTGCTFSRNTATNSSGGAIFNSGGTSTLIGCTFTDNTATFNGGAIVTVNSTFTSCTFTGNRATQGGAICNYGNSAITGCTFTGNVATFNGGAIYNLASITIRANTMVNNGVNIVNEPSTNTKMNVIIDTKLNIVTKISNRKITITVTAMDENKNPISGKTIDFSVNGIQVASRTTNNNGVATYVYTAPKARTYKIDAKIKGFTNITTVITVNRTDPITNITTICNFTTNHTYLAASSTRDTTLTTAKLKLNKVTTSKAAKKKGKKIYTKTYSYKNSGHITGSKTFTIKISKKYNIQGKITKSATISSAKYDKKTKKITVKVKNLAYNKIAQVRFKIVQR